MGYTIGSGKDSRHDKGFTEPEVLARFVARQAEIMAYKKAHGGDLEGAFQAVTGEPWPTGRSVKVHGDGRAEFTKDRTTKSVLGKYVALPAAIAAGGYFAAPAIAGALAGGGAAAGGGVAGGGLGTGALGVGATIPGAGAVSGIGGGSVFGSLAGGIGKTALSQGASRALSAYGQSEANNRGAQTAAMLDANKQLEEQLMAREQNTRRATSDTYANAMQAQHGMTWHPAVRPAGVPGSTPDLNPQSREAAGTLYAQMLAKMKAGDTLPKLDPMTNLPLRPGTGERIAGYGSVFASLLGR